MGRPERVFLCVFDFGHYTADLLSLVWMWVGSSRVAGSVLLEVTK